MDSRRIPQLPTPRGDTSRKLWRIWQTAAGAAKTLAGKGISWCRDHLLLTAALASLSLMTAVFFLNRTDPEVTGNEPGSEVDALALPGIPENAPLANIIPEGPIAGQSPELLTFEAPIGRAKYSQSIEGEDPLEGPALPLSASGVSRDKSGPGCVWLTGVIEPVEPDAEIIQDASRVHELTMPARY